MTKIKEIKNQLISLGLILVCGILIWQYRIFQANNQLKELSSLDKNGHFKNHAYFDTLTFEIFLFLGFILGTIISLIIFKSVNRSGK